MEAIEYEFKRGFPTAETARKVKDEADLNRALVAYRFFYPTVSMEAGLEGLREAGARENQDALVLSCGPRHLLFTGNSDTPYLQAGLDLKESGPMVLEVPRGALLGVVNDHNFRWIADVGMAGPDAGRGGRYLILPPEYEGVVPSGYFTASSATYKVTFALRALPAEGDLGAARALLTTVKIHSLAEASNPPAYNFIDVSERDDVDTTVLRQEDNFAFWQYLHKAINEEPAFVEFRPMYGFLAALGIEKGKPFEPDTRMKAILRRAAGEGRDQMLVSGFGSSRPDRFVWPDRKWERAALRYENGDFELPTGIDVEARERWFSQAVGVSPKMFLQSAGAGSIYWLGLRDKDGAYLDGGKTYRLNIPEPVPQKLFWSVTVYDSETRSMIQTDQDKAALRSLVELKDFPKTGVTDLYFGPTPPAGKDAQWIKTMPGKGWFAYFRLYAPEAPAFDGTWKPGDFEVLK